MKLLKWNLFLKHFIIWTFYLNISLMNKVYDLPLKIKFLFFPFYSTHFMKPGISKLCRTLRLHKIIIQMNMMSFAISFLFFS